jgi:uncharacterized protein DUF4340
VGRAAPEMTSIQRNLVLALAMLGAGGGSALYVYFARIANKAEREAGEREERRLFHFDPKEVKKGVIHARGATIAFSRDPAFGWRITSPVDAPADVVAIENALDRMANVRGETVDTGEITRAVLDRYELARPKVSIEVDTPSGPLRLIVGPKNQLDDRVFATDGAHRKIILAEGPFAWTLDRGLDAFRDARIFPISDKQILRIAVFEKGKPRFIVSRSDPSAAFTISDGEHPPMPADEADVALLLVTLTSRLRAESWITDQLPSEDPAELEKLGMKHFDFMIELATAKETARALLGFLRETAAERVTSIAHVVGTKSVAVVPDWIHKDIDKHEVDLVDHSIARFDRDAVQQIELALGRDSVTLERKPGGGEAWTIGKDRKPALDWKVSPILLIASRFRAEKWLSDNPTRAELEKWGLAAPSRRARFFDGKGELLADIAVGAAIDEDNVAVMATGSKRIAAYKKRILDILPERASELVARSP